MAGTDVELYRQNISDLSTLAFRDINGVLTLVRNESGETVRNTLIDALPEIVNPYMVASGDISATWYEDRRNAALGGSYYATSSGAVDTTALESLIRWGVRPLFGDSAATVLSLIGGGVQRMIADAGRDTVIDNAQKDVASVSWRRVARPGACDWCKMLAGRGDVYHSRKSASRVVGAGVDIGESYNWDLTRKRGGLAGGIKPRGVQPIKAGYHDHCECVVEPTFYFIDSMPNPRTGGAQQVLRPITGSQRQSLLALN